MRNLITIALIFAATVLNAATYYVSPSGSNAYPGTISEPWETFVYAFAQLSAGDTLYARGGVYDITSTQEFDVSGSAGNYICIFAYPGETPIIDGTSGTGEFQGIHSGGDDYVYIKGLTIRNIRENSDQKNAHGFYTNYCDHWIIENCTAHNMIRGYWSQNCDDIHYINCDAYNCADTLTEGGADAGNAGDGFLVFDSGIEGDTLKKIYLTGCRAWNCSDDAYDLETEGTIYVDSCWGFYTGWQDLVNVEGNGIKLGLIDYEASFISRYVTNCITAWCKHDGITCNDNVNPTRAMNIFNNTDYKSGTGFRAYDSPSSAAVKARRVFTNNIAYDNTYNDFSDEGSYSTDTYNSWNNPPGATVTDADFINLDSITIFSQLTAARGPDGSLPDITCLTLAEGSDLIDAGTDVGIDYEGTAPDLGAFEYMEEPEPASSGTLLKNSSGNLLITSDGKLLKL